MRILMIFIILGGFGLISAGCMGTGVNSLYGGTNTHPAPPYGDQRVQFMMNRGGLLVHMNAMPGQIGQNAEARKTGESCSHNVFGLVAWGDSSIARAKENGGITKVASLDHEMLGLILGMLYHRHCTVVTGE